ncbi:type II secretion system F family protein [Halarcobacter sp.]|uniref:type II secretion system F family protein n=1 Tax=Halarcobacter sp. TaxID=2321133 RepID=UPI002AABA6BD|nr:type II secretion system F family protein [Halarcobacter sp.]
MFEHKYIITYQEEGEIKAKKVLENVLHSDSLPNNIISIKKLNFSFDLTPTISEKDIKNRLYELDLMLSSNILLDEALNILIKNEKKQVVKNFLKDLKEVFCSYGDLNLYLKKYKINPLVKSLFTIIQESGNSISNIKFLSYTIKENYEIKKEFLKTMLYPIILLITFVLSLIGIFNFVVPNFESILLNSNIQLSFATKTLFLLRDIFFKNILEFLLFIVLSLYLVFKVYSKNKSLRKVLDKILLFNKLYEVKQLHLFFVVFEILLKNNFDLIYSINKAKILIKNQILLDRITQIEYLLKKGKSVRFSFESSNLFDDVILSLIETGEVTNTLPKVISEIKNIYKKRFDDNLKIFSLLIEPLFFIIIMALILWLVFAIFVPLWDMNDMIKV